jgi:hypothetical protein
MWWTLKRLHSTLGLLSKESNMKNLFLVAVIALLVACGAPESSNHHIQSYVVHQTNGEWQFWHIIRNQTNVYYSVGSSNVPYADAVWLASTTNPSFLSGDTNLFKLSHATVYYIDNITDLIKSGKTQAQREAAREAAADAAQEAASMALDMLSE